MNEIVGDIWEVQIFISERNDFEISVIKKDNKLGHESWGWSGKDKIILFDSQGINNSGLDISEEYDRYFMIDIANKLCEVMNKR